MPLAPPSHGCRDARGPPRLLFWPRSSPAVRGRKFKEALGFEKGPVHKGKGFFTAPAKIVLGRIDPPG